VICLTRRCGAWLPQVCSLFRASDRTPREAPIPLDAELINAFLSAVQTVLVQETGVSATRESRPGIDRSTTTPYEITAIIGITGDIAGMVMISMPKETALRFYSAVMGEEKTEADSIVASAIAEFTNTVSGTAAITLDDKGLSAAAFLDQLQGKSAKSPLALGKDITYTGDAKAAEAVLGAVRRGLQMLAVAGSK